MSQTSQTVDAPIAAPKYVLNASDRCDTCSARAYYEVTLPIGESKVGKLLFCAHHFRKGEQRLREKALSIVDESEKLSL